MRVDNDGRGLIKIADSFSEGVHKFAMLQWDTGLLAWVKLTANDPSGAYSNVYITNTPSFTQANSTSAPFTTDNRRSLLIRHAVISQSASGDTTVVAAAPGQKIKVLHYTFICTAANVVTFKSGATNLTGAMEFDAKGGISTPSSSPGDSWLMETAINQDLIINLSAASGVRGHLVYFLEA